MGIFETLKWAIPAGWTVFRKVYWFCRSLDGFGAATATDLTITHKITFRDETA